MIHHWHPWSTDGNRRTLAPESEWRLPIEWNREAEASGERATVIVGPDVFRNFSDNAVFVYRHPDGVYERREIGRHLFCMIDACPHLDFVLTTSEPGRVTRLLKGNLRGVEAVRNFRNRPNVILSAGPIRTQADADRLIPDLLKLRDLCGGLGVTAEPVEKIDLSLVRTSRDTECNPLTGEYRQWCDEGVDHPADEQFFDGGPYVTHLLLAGGNPEHSATLAGQCRAAGCEVIFADRHD